MSMAACTCALKAARARCARRWTASAANDLTARSGRALREQRLAFFDDAAPLWRLSLPNNTPLVDLPGAALLDWGGAQRWLKSDAQRRCRFASIASAAVATRPASRTAPDVDPFHPLAAPLMRYHRQLKAAPRSARHLQSRAHVRRLLTLIEGDRHANQSQRTKPRHLPRAKEAEDILRSCVHCGFCNATCPTYQLLGNELDGPRGRIYLIKQMLEGEPVTDKTQLHLDRCLTCRNCETTCPSGVDYHALLDIGRADARAARRRGPLAERLLRDGLRHVIPRAGDVRRAAEGRAR